MGGYRQRSNSDLPSARKQAVEGSDIGEVYLSFRLQVVQCFFEAIFEEAKAETGKCWGRQVEGAKVSEEMHGSPMTCCN